MHRLTLRPICACPTTARGVSLLETIIVLAIIGIMMGMLLPALHQVHMHSLRIACDNNVQQLSIALGTYGETHRAFPPVPDPECPVGWSLALLPYMEEQPLFDLVMPGQPRTSPANLAAAAKRPSLFVCPATEEVASTIPAIGVTNYVLVIDPVYRMNWKRGAWRIQEAPEGSRYPWTFSPEIPWNMGNYPPAHPSAFGF